MLMEMIKFYWQFMLVKMFWICFISAVRQLWKLTASCTIKPKIYLLSPPTALFIYIQLMKVRFYGGKVLISDILVSLVLFTALAD